MTRLLPIFPLLLALAGGVGAQAPAGAPAAESRPKPTKTEKPPIYDEAADARAEIAKAVADAKKNEKRVLVQWGANWCGWCRLLHDIMKKDRDLAKEILYEYDVVLVDVGQFDKNKDLGKELGASFKDGIPYLTILGADGKPIANEETAQFELADKSKPGHDAAKLMEFLKKNQAATTPAADLYAAALARAKDTNKRLFLDFSAPW
jgi:thiol-disulfide isomerase/thioredoxin